MATCMASIRCPLVHAPASDTPEAITDMISQAAVVRDDVSSLPFHLLLPLPCSGVWASRDAPGVAYRRPWSSRTRRVLPQPR